VTHLGVYTPSSKSLQAAVAVLSTLVYSSCKEFFDMGSAPGIKFTEKSISLFGGSPGTS
jgi:hypothetical protein